MIFSNSTRNMITGCKRELYFWNELGLRPIKENHNFLFGGLWHDILEMFYNIYRAYEWDYYLPSVVSKKHRLRLIPREVPEIPEDITAIISDITENMIQQKSMTISEEDFEKWSNDDIPMLRSMAKTYNSTAQKILREFEIIGVEVPFILKMSKTHGTYKVSWVAPQDIKDKVRSTLYCGVMDLLLKRKDGFGFGEHKTTTESTPESYVVHVDANYQSIGYTTAVQAFCKYLRQGKSFGGIYIGSRKKVPSVPSINQCTKCKGKGFRKLKNKEPEPCLLCDETGKGVISSRKIETTKEIVDSVVERCPHLLKEDFMEFRKTFADYREKVQSDNWHFYFYRNYTPEDIRLWLEDTWEVVKQYRIFMRRYKREGVKVFTRSWDYFRCPKCMFFSICKDASKLKIRLLYKTLPESIFPVEFKERLDEVLNGNTTERNVRDGGRNSCGF